MPKRTSTPRDRNAAVSSATGYCACATAMPYPGVMMTDRAEVSSSATDAASVSRCSPCSSSPPRGASMPKPPAITDRNDRFMALHMMYDR